MMPTALRFVVALITALGTFYFVFWVGGALLFFQLGLPDWMTVVASGAAAFIVTRYVWTRTASPAGGLLSAVATGAFITGGIGFSAGFFGPLLFAPGANQGPLLGIFITGPLGFVLGAIGGAVYWLARRRG